MIRIMTDSTTDIEQGLLGQHRLDVIPLGVTIGETSYLDGVDITLSEVYDAMRVGIMPKTTQISTEHCYNTFKGAALSGDDFIYIAFSSAMSSTYATARIVCEEVQQEHPERKMRVIDSRGGSMATGLIVLQALKMAELGLGFDTICSEVEWMTNHIEHVFTIADLSWISKGGRISKAAGFAGNLLGIKPVLDVKDGMIQMVKTAKGFKRSIEEVAEMVVERSRNFTKQLIAIAHADDRAVALELKSTLEKSLPDCGFTIMPIGSVLGVHLGLSGVGAFFFSQKPEYYIDIEPVAP